MPDLRSTQQKAFDDMFGMPLYYCSECLRSVRVKDGKIERPCTDCCDAEVYAPRKAVAVGRGGASMKTKAKIRLAQLLAFLTQRSGVHGGV